jgi:hypothetical protein
LFHPSVPLSAFLCFRINERKSQGGTYLIPFLQAVLRANRCAVVGIHGAISFPDPFRMRVIFGLEQADLNGGPGDIVYLVIGFA